MSSKKRADLQYYFKHLNRKPYPFACPRCQISILPKHYENHCFEKHGINSKYCCVWCLGTVKWPKRKKYENVDHLLSCSRKFITLNSKTSTNTPSNNDPTLHVSATSHSNTSILNKPKLPIMTEMCPSLKFFNHSSHYIRKNLPGLALGHFSLLNVECISLFQNDILNLAAS